MLKPSTQHCRTEGNGEIRVARNISNKIVGWTASAKLTYVNHFTFYEPLNHNA
jgi:hypothetical protein